MRATVDGEQNRPAHLKNKTELTRTLIRPVELSKVHKRIGYNMDALVHTDPMACLLESILIVLF